MWPNPLETADLVTFTEKSLTENFVFRAVLPWVKNISTLENFEYVLNEWYYGKFRSKKRCLTHMHISEPNKHLGWSFFCDTN